MTKACANRGSFAFAVTLLVINIELPEGFHPIDIRKVVEQELSAMSWGGNPVRPELGSLVFHSLSTYTSAPAARNLALISSMPCFLACSTASLLESASFSASLAA
jgi:hypothetical protein